jgi:ribonucleotide monophosphatase NagD (HAD superfamily)
MIAERFRLDAREEAGMLAELRGGLVRQIVPDDAVTRALRAARAWMIGDSAEADIAGARSSGLSSVWLHRGRRWPLTAFEPGHVADSFPRAVEVVLGG